MKYIKGNKNYIEHCIQALQESDLGQAYFSSYDKAKEAILEGLDLNQIFLILDDKNAFVGFLQHIPKGAFHSFPYLHIIAISKGARGRGFGRLAMAYFESTLCKGSSKVFLVVADFNPRGKAFYEKLGYCEVGRIPNLYRTDITEILMMKNL